MRVVAIPLGELIRFYIPSLELGRPDGFTQEALHEFLAKEFGGFTVASAHTRSYVRHTSIAADGYGEHAAYTIYLRGTNGKDVLFRHLAALAHGLKLPFILVETNDGGSLLPPTIE